MLIQAKPRQALFLSQSTNSRFFIVDDLTGLWRSSSFTVVPPSKRSSLIVASIRAHEALILAKMVSSLPSSSVPSWRRDLLELVGLSDALAVLFALPIGGCLPSSSPIMPKSWNKKPGNWRGSFHWIGSFCCRPWICPQMQHEKELSLALIHPVISLPVITTFSALDAYE